MDLGAVRRPPYGAVHFLIWWTARHRSELDFLALRYGLVLGDLTMRDGLVFAYGALTTGLDEPQLEDLEAIMRGETPPSIARDAAERDANNLEAAVRGGARIMGA